MKTLKKCWFFLGLMMAMLCFTACSEDDEELIPSFPTVTESITAAAGESKAISFTANMEWNLSSNQTWCLLGNEQRQNISGTVGQQNVIITINDNGLEFDKESSANIILAMGAESKTIATITRSSKAYEFQIKDVEGNVVKVLEVGTTGIATYYAESNFEFAATNYDEDLMSITKGENKGGTYNYEINIEIKNIKYPVSGANVKFQNESGTQAFLYSLNYTGMDSNKIEFNPGTTWGIYVYADGSAYYSKLNTDNIYEAPYSVTLTALNDAYTLIYYKYDNNWGMSQYQSHETPWFSVNDDKKGNLKVSFIPNDESERKGYLFAFPNAFYETIKSDLDAFIVDNMNASVWEMSIDAEKYLVAEYIQEANQNATATGFTVKLFGYLDVETTQVTDSNILDFVAGECMYSGSEVYSISVDPGSYLQIFPNLPEDKWNCEIQPMFIGIEDESELQYEAGIWEDGKHYFSVVVPGVSEPIYVALRDQNWAFHKVLIIYPY